MTNTSDPRYGITVAPRTRRIYESEEQWDADTHRYIDIKSTLCGPVAHPYSGNEILAAFLWAAGLLARLGWDLQWEIRSRNEDQGHRCERDSDGSWRCGYVFEDAVTSGKQLRSAAETAARYRRAPRYTVGVPTEHADEWVKDIRQLVADMLADYITPLCPTTPNPDHGHAVLTEPIPQRRPAGAP